MKNERMRITAWPRCGIQSDKYLPLDGILHASMMRRTFGAEDVTVAGDMAQWGGQHGSIPLQRKSAGGVWFYACSFADWGDVWADDTGFWAKRFDQASADLIDFDGRRGKIDVSSGLYKGYQMPVYTRSALRVYWYAVGDMERVRDLLSDVTHIGKKTSQGYGRINLWDVEAWPHDWSMWRDGKPTRAIPAQDGALYGVRPPYWRAANQTTCTLP